MTFPAGWPKNGGEEIRDQQTRLKSVQGTAATQLHPLLSGRYIKEKYCNSGIAMFLRRPGKRLEMIFGTINFPI